jgi:hypothetical protein
LTASASDNWSHYVTQTGLLLSVLLLQPPRCWDYRRALPCPADFLQFGLVAGWSCFLL